MSFNPVGNILCQRCENFVDGHDCNKCGWEQLPYEEHPLTRAEARIEELESLLSQMIYASIPVSNAAYNLAWQHRDQVSVHENISILDGVRNSASRLLKENK